MRNAALLALAAVFTTATAQAAKPVAARACAPVVRDAWVRMTPTMPMGAGYFSVVNPCRTPVVLVAARSDEFADVSMHETRIEAGVSRMRPLPSVRVDAGAGADFAPGGRHLMLMSPRGTVSAGMRVHLRLDFADGRHLDVLAPVRAAAP